MKILKFKDIDENKIYNENIKYQKILEELNKKTTNNN